MARRVRGNGVGKIACGRAGDGVKSEAVSVSQGHRDYAVFKTQRGQAYRVILDEEMTRS